MLLLLLLACLSQARIIYKVRTSGTCKESLNSPINDKTICETQATVLDWSDTSASIVSFSSYLPQGCFIMTETNSLRLYPGESSNKCSEKYKCVCQVEAPDCIVGVNLKECLCQDSPCSRDTGLICTQFGECEHAPPCKEGENDNVCQCGANDCTPSSGLVCSNNVCTHAEICANRIGTMPNSKTCQCGENDCSPTIGTYCHSESSTCRQPCAGGMYVNHLLNCETCNEAGFYCPAGATMSPTNFKCPAGRYGPQAGISSAEECLPCSAGRFSIIDGITSNEHCTGRCPAGKYSAELGLSSPEQCIGQCSAGKYSSETGLTSDEQCIGRCSAGKYSSYTGLTNNDQCFECPAGKYSTETGLKYPEKCMGKCSAGKYSDQTGLITDNECKVCSVNKYQDEIGMSSCKGCPDNKIIIDTSDSKKHDNINDCTEAKSICSAVQYIENNKCKECPVSFYCDGTSQIPCPPGSFCEGDGKKKDCPVGKYGAAPLQTSVISCKECEKGTYQNVVGQTYCARGCPRGKYGQIKGASSEKEGCISCDKGHMCDDTAMNRPIPCPMGSYQDQSGKETCFFCPKDTYSNVQSSTECIPCGKNKQGDFLRTTGLGANSPAQCQILVKTCAITQYPTRMDECKDCKQGFYGNGKGTKCIACPIGFYQPNEGQFNCLECTTRRCNSIKAAADLSNRLPMNITNDIRKNVIPDNSNPFPVAIIIVYVSLSSSILLIICSHRLCPHCFKNLDFMFSGDHIVPDTHARRIISSRLGAAFTISLPIVVSIISVFVFTSNNTLTQNGLIPIATAQISPLKGLYGEIEIQFISESSIKVETCDNIENNHNDMNCTVDNKHMDEYTCETHMKCSIDSPFGGMHSILFTFPDNFQRAQLYIAPSMWNKTQYNLSTALYSKDFIAGTLKYPSTIDFDVIRSKINDHIQNTEQFGLQMTLRDNNVVTDNLGAEKGLHFVEIRFFSTENLFVKEVMEKLGIITRIGTVLTLTISALSGLKAAKLSLEHCIDNSIIKCCKRVPNDIARRAVILEEKEQSQLEIYTQNPLEKKPKKQIILDPVTGKSYVYDPNTKTSTWLEETL